MRKILIIVFSVVLFQQNISAQCSAPSAPTSLFLSSTNSDISIFFDSTTTANGYLAIMSTSSSLSTTPVNGTVYTLGESLGGGTVIYKGNNYQFVAGGLTSNVTYYFYVYSYKTGCTGEPRYSASSLNGNVKTYNGSAGIPAGYYSTTTGLNCTALKTALYNIIKPTLADPSPTYKGILGAHMLTDRRLNDAATQYIVWDQYSDNPSGAEPYEFTFGSPYRDVGTSGTLEGQRYNREHTFPQAWFGGSVEPMYSDMFIVFPSDKKINGLRGNNPYGKVTTPTYTTLNGGKIGNNTFSPAYTSPVYEVTDAYKGDVARGNLYVATAYEDKVAAWKTNSNADDVLAGNTYPAFDDWYIKLLYQWHIQDPVSQKEIDRNNAVYMIQGARNPYIDHPEYVALVWQCTGLLPVTLVDFTATKGDRKVILKWYATYEKNFKSFEIERSTDAITYEKIGTVEGRNLNNYSFTDDRLPNKNVVYYRLKLLDADGKFEYSKIVSVKLNNNFSNALIYPNPANGKLNIQLEMPLAEKTNIVVTDAAGKKVMNLYAASGEANITLTVSSLPAGRYFVTLTNNVQAIQQSFVIVR